MMNNTLMSFKLDTTDKYDASNNSENNNNMDFISAKGRVEIADKITETLDKKSSKFQTHSSGSFTRWVRRKRRTSYCFRRYANVRYGT